MGGDMIHGLSSKRDFGVLGCSLGPLFFFLFPFGLPTAAPDGWVLVIRTPQVVPVRMQDREEDEHPRRAVGPRTISAATMDFQKAVKGDAVVRNRSNACGKNIAIHQ